MSVPAIVLITGDDDALVTEAVRAAVTAALDGEDRSLALEELTEEDYRTEDGFEVARLVDAAQTPPFLTGRRVVVGRHLGRFSDKESVVPLVVTWPTRWIALHSSSSGRRATLRSSSASTRYRSRWPRPSRRPVVRSVRRRWGVGVRPTSGSTTGFPRVPST